jgi:hypothetical protein
MPFDSPALSTSLGVAIYPADVSPQELRTLGHSIWAWRAVAERHDEFRVVEFDTDSLNALLAGECPAPVAPRLLEAFRHPEAWRISPWPFSLCVHGPLIFDAILGGIAQRLLDGEISIVDACKTLPESLDQYVSFTVLEATEGELFDSLWPCLHHDAMDRLVFTGPQAREGGGIRFPKRMWFTRKAS